MLRKLKSIMMSIGQATPTVAEGEVRTNGGILYYYSNGSEHTVDASQIGAGGTWLSVGSVNTIVGSSVSISHGLGSTPTAVKVLMRTGDNSSGVNVNESYWTTGNNVSFMGMSFSNSPDTEFPGQFATENNTDGFVGKARNGIARFQGHGDDNFFITSVDGTNVNIAANGLQGPVTFYCAVFVK